jgi:hypothetical protein
MTTTYIEGVQQERSEISRLRQTIYATQPLQSVTIEWSFPEMPPEVLEEVTNARAGVEAEMTKFAENASHYTPLGLNDLQSASERAHILLPLLNSLGRAPWKNESAVALFALDDAAAAIIPLGSLSYDLAQSLEGGQRKSAPIEVAAGIHADGPRTRFLSRESTAVVQTKGRCVTIHWELPGPDYFHAVDKVDARFVPTSKLPDRMRVMILTRIKLLPVNPEAMTTSRWPLPWQAPATTDATPPGFRDSKLTLTPNRLTDTSVTYNMRLVSVTKLEDSVSKMDEKEPNVEYCYAALWSGERLTPARQ